MRPLVHYTHSVLSTSLSTMHSTIPSTYVVRAKPGRAIYVDTPSPPRRVKLVSVKIEPKTKYDGTPDLSPVAGFDDWPMPELTLPAQAVTLSDDSDSEEDTAVSLARMRLARNGLKRRITRALNRLVELEREVKRVCFTLRDLRDQVELC